MRNIALLHLALCLASIGASAGAPRVPLCAVRSGVEGGPAILINNKPVAPLFFAANNQFGQDETLLAELRQAAEAGLPLFSFNLHLDWRSTPEQTAAVVEKFCAAHPQGFFYVRIWLGAPPKWLDAHPEDCLTKADGTRLGWASPASEAWQREAAAQLDTRVRELAEGPHGDRFLGVCLTYLQTGEWFYPETNEYLDYSPANLKAFRAWLKRQYRTDRALRKAWGAPDASIESAILPLPEARESAAWGPFRDPVRGRAAMDMERFQNELIAETIARFARVVKGATRGRSLVGAFYGYTMELNDNGPRALAQSGHLALARLLDCPDIDMIHAPHSYFERAVGRPGHLHLPVDSIPLHRKLVVLEEDTFTHLAHEPSPDLIAPGWNERTTTPDETMAVFWRNAAICLAHRCGMWCFDLLSDGRWAEPRVWEAMPLLRRLFAEARGEPVPQPEVAFLVNEEAVRYLRASNAPWLLPALSYSRAELDRLGAPVGYYLQRDLPRLPASVKVIWLANAFEISKEERQALNRFLARGGAVIWGAASGIGDGDTLDLANVADTTGLPVAAKLEAGSLALKTAPDTPEFALEPEPRAPVFFVERELAQMEVLARYAATGDIAVAAVPFRGGVSIYTGVSRLSVDLLRDICRRCGVHLYREAPGMVGVFGPYLAIHTASSPAPREASAPGVAENDASATEQFAWKMPVARIHRVIPFSASLAANVATWADTLQPNTTALYRCEGQPRIEEDEAPPTR